jgi:alkylation response protein AidB-like acyl-CoA dehydrogenase
VKRPIEPRNDVIARAEQAAHMLAPRAAVRGRAGTLPREELEHLAASGLLAAAIPDADGAVDFTTAAEVVRVLAIADAGLARIVLDHHLFVARLARHGSTGQQRRFYSELLAGRRFASATLESGGAEHRARLRRDHVSDGHRLDGQKFRVTGALLADWLVVRALDERGRVALACIERSAPGLGLLDLYLDGDLRASASCGLLLEAVLVPPTQVLFLPARDPLDAAAQLLHAALDVGIARAAWTDLVRLVRGDPGRSLAGHELARRIGELAIAVRAAEALLRSASELLDHPTATDDGVLAVAEVKTHAAQVAVEVCSELLAHGDALGLSLDDELVRHWQSALEHSVHDPGGWKDHHIGNFYLHGAWPPGADSE